MLIIYFNINYINIILVQFNINFILILMFNKNIWMFRNVTNRYILSIWAEIAILMRFRDFSWDETFWNLGHYSVLNWIIE